MHLSPLLDRCSWHAALPLLAQFGANAEADDGAGGRTIWYLFGVAVVLVAAFVIVIVMFSYGKLWMQAVMSNAHVSMLSLIGMSLRQVQARTIVEAKIMAMQAAVGGD